MVRRRPWEVYPPRGTFGELWDGVPGLRLNARDLTMLGHTLDHHFLAVRHYQALGYFPDAPHTSRRLLALVRARLLARKRMPRWRQGDPRHQGYVYTLTAFGYKCLYEWGWATAEEHRVFTPFWQTPNMRNNPEHELGVADLVVGLMTALGPDVTVEWKGSREAVQVLGADNRVGGRHLLAPDALAILTGPGTRDIVLLEYEQAATAPRIAHKIAGLIQYYRLQPWRKPGATLTAPPKVLWSVGRTADRRRYWRSPLEEVRRQAGPEPFLYDRLWLVAEKDWRAGRWGLQSVRPGTSGRIRCGRGC